ncbi:hypothetical protein A1Q2_00478 [Trichosporon asahii var. asahii CBS 8904]|uniref:Uncharacterized protein n=1 Tax=Trichosporon asahii var. asahii (strain CBS 8904) TaxID=1220162 RepID=K1W8W3_TRIAC|nr:hypothetical protein A1Q2_00478 [Trichosporon asahii var. asahii CBS 8904]
MKLTASASKDLRPTWQAHDETVVSYRPGYSSIPTLPGELCIEVFPLSSPLFTFAVTLNWIADDSVLGILGIAHSSSLSAVRLRTHFGKPSGLLAHELEVSYITAEPRRELNGLTTTAGQLATVQQKPTKSFARWVSAANVRAI